MVIYKSSVPDGAIQHFYLFSVHILPYYSIRFEFVACHSRESGNPDCKEVDSASSAE